MKILIIFLAAVLAALAGFAAIRHMEPNIEPEKTSGLQFTDQISIGGVQLRVAVAKTGAQKNQGLSGHPGLGESEGMLFEYQDSPGIPSFWMKQMLFPIDIIWIRDNIVVDVSRDAGVPEAGTTLESLPRYSPSAEVDTVVEVAAGWSARHNVGPGSKVERDR